MQLRGNSSKIDSTARAQGVVIALLLFSAVGCATNPSNPDPWEKTNRFFYRSDERFDRHFVTPVSNFYIKHVPAPIRTALGNAFDNLGYVDVILNDFLQAKWKQGLADAWRMTLNSTFGVAGLVDIATRQGFPSHDNDFGVTLGIWGFGPGPYLVLPFYGPSTMRDAPDIAVSTVTNPLFWIDVPLAATIGMDVSQAIETRSEYESALRFRNAAAVDPYLFTREAYLAYRRHLIHPNEAATESDMYDEPQSPPASQPTTEHSDPTDSAPHPTDPHR